MFCSSYIALGMCEFSSGVHGALWSQHAALSPVFFISFKYEIKEELKAEICDSSIL